ncbi:hypothetical protein QE152_g12483 [Popillia japonica]|uniref:Uncharacterized protein n=1 Tax=Popillia japonica TaxID=7064 RepID=A0AAW1LQZ7_POPJA
MNLEEEASLLAILNEDKEEEMQYARVVKYNKLDMMAQTALNAGHTARNMQALNCLDRSTATATAIIATALTKKLSCISFGMPANII